MAKTDLRSLEILNSDHITKAVFELGLEPVIRMAIKAAAMKASFEPTSRENYHMNRAVVFANIAARVIAAENSQEGRNE